MNQATANVAVVVALIIVGFAAIWILLRKRRQKPTTVEAKGFTSIQFRPSESGKLLTALVSASFDAGEEAKSNVVHLLELLMSDPVAAIAEIDHAYRTLTEQAYNARWTLVYVAARLEHAACLSFLKYVSTLPLPAEKSTDLCHHSTVGEETMIRTRAVQGLTVLALSGNADARTALLDMLQADAISIKAEAVLGLLQLPESERAEMEPRIREVLGEKYAYLRNLRRVKPEEARTLFAIRAKAMDIPEATAGKPHMRRAGEQADGQTAYRHGGPRIKQRERGGKNG